MHHFQEQKEWSNVKYPAFYLMCLTLFMDLLHGYLFYTSHYYNIEIM